MARKVNANQAQAGLRWFALGIRVGSLSPAARKEFDALFLSLTGGSSLDPRTGAPTGNKVKRLTDEDIDRLAAELMRLGGST